MGFNSAFKGIMTNIEPQQNKLLIYTGSEA